MDGWLVEVEFPVHWGEMDALGHVNNTRYITWFENARVAFFERLGFRTLPSSPVGPILARIECDYREPVVFPAHITVGARAGKLGNTSLVVDTAAWHTGDRARIVAEGRAVIVMTDYVTMRKVPIPAELRHTLQGGSR